MGAFPHPNKADLIVVRRKRGLVEPGGPLALYFRTQALYAHLTEEPMDRRKFLVNSGIVGAGVLGAGAAVPGVLQATARSEADPNLNLEEKPVAFTVPPLLYPFDALEPHIDASHSRLGVRSAFWPGHSRGSNFATLVSGTARLNGHTS